MELGAKLRQARLELGLSQRQLCGDVITRNMLSQIENGSARPSMDTLTYLAGRLNRPVSYFLEETAFVSSNTSCIANARQAYIEGCFADALQILQEYQSPDALLDAEFGLLKYLALLALAEESAHRRIYAQQLLAQAAQQESCYITPELTQRRLLLLGQINGEYPDLPGDDKPLLYRANIARNKGDYTRCVALLEACEDRESRQWHYLRGEAAFFLGEYEIAIQYYPPDCYGELEQCYRNLGDYKMAYEYACKQRENPSISAKGNV